MEYNVLELNSSVCRTFFSSVLIEWEEDKIIYHDRVLIDTILQHIKRQDLGALYEGFFIKILMTL